MTRRKALRKELSRLRYHLRRIEHLVGVCKIYDDDYVTEHDIIKIKEKIQEVEREYERTI